MTTGHGNYYDVDGRRSLNERWPNADGVAAVGGLVRELKTDGGSAAATDADIETILDELEAFEDVNLREADPDTLSRYWDAQDRLIDAIDAELDKDTLSEATHIWWNDQAEFHLYCSSHYHPIASEQWTGFTEVTDPQAVKQAARDRLESGVPCEKCHSEALFERRDELLAERGLA
ncbi:hypothetical protein [Haloarcula sp. Atlit-120R]|uniref:hypothetical protein n=1 Tax=Haloarcula sp. Atlit-120R TaxID=2282135 RepID=UPI000EF1FB53|nr:hypothetical protein [Haloarcula sp. Atlit-120R]RLM32787.1 hypothetical protein DVK01_19860 [Haloarcula sp. Atlit-120R]